MSKTWYPVIDYDKCTGCLACFEKCSHGVYELNSRNLPKVVGPEGCVQNCTGCGDLCPTQAITYIGDSIGKIQTEGCGCEGGNASCCGEGEESCCGGSDQNECGCGGGGCCS